MNVDVKLNDHVFKIQLDLDLLYKNNELEVVNCSGKVVDKIKVEDTSYTEICLSETMVNFGILTLGSKGLGALIPVNDTVNVKFFDNDVLKSMKSCNTHSVSKGRINGLTKIFKDNADVLSANSIVKVSYNPLEKELKIMV